MASKGVAIVTGSAQGIGRAIALRLAADRFNVALCDLASQRTKLDEVAEQIRLRGSKAIAFTTDVSAENQVKSLIEDTIKEFGSLNVMVANAGKITVNTILDTPTEDFESLMSTNVKGTFLCYKYAAKQMIKQGEGGRIIGASSVAGKKGIPGLNAYSSSKFAIRALTQTAAQEWGSHGITVNAYAPGCVDTEMLGPLDNFITSQTGMQKGEGVKFLVKDTALARIGSPIDVASLVSYLASREAGFITGQSISVDGGYCFS